MSTLYVFNYKETVKFSFEILSEFIDNGQTEHSSHSLKGKGHIIKSNRQYCFINK